MAPPPPKQPPPIEEMGDAEPPPWTEEEEPESNDPHLRTADAGASRVAIFAGEPCSAAPRLRLAAPPAAAAPAPAPDEGEPRGLIVEGPCDEAQRRRPAAEVESVEEPNLDARAGVGAVAPAAAAAAEPVVGAAPQESLACLEEKLRPCGLGGGEGKGVGALAGDTAQPLQALALAGRPEKVPPLRGLGGGLSNFDVGVKEGARAVPIVVAPPVGAVAHVVRPHKLPHGLGRGRVDRCDSGVAVHQLAAVSAADAVLQPTKVSELLPHAIRVDFVKKVYGILSAMLLVTFGVTAPFVFATEATYDFFIEHVGILYVVFGLMLAMYVYHWCMLCAICCDVDCFMDAYLTMMKTAPWNYLYLFTFAGCFGVIVGFVCATYTAESVVLAFGVTALLVIALSVYAVKTKADFTGCGGYVVVLLLGLVCLTVILTVFPHSHIGSKVTAGVGAIIFGFIIVSDTQLIFGGISENRTFEYTLDMYAFAAWNLYLDFINMFLYLLRFLGSRPT